MRVSGNLYFSGHEQGTNITSGRNHGRRQGGGHYKERYSYFVGGDCVVYVVVEPWGFRKVVAKARGHTGQIF